MVVGIVELVVVGPLVPPEFAGALTLTGLGFAPEDSVEPDPDAEPLLPLAVALWGEDVWRT